MSRMKLLGMVRIVPGVKIFDETPSLFVQTVCPFFVRDSKRCVCVCVCARACVCVRACVYLLTRSNENPENAASMRDR